MQRVEWSEFLSVGHAKIDEDHKRLFEILNRLADGEQRRKRAVVAEAVEQMIRYAGEHFAREEELMAAIRYPLLTEHAQHHRELAAKVQTWRTRVAERWHPWHGGTFFVVLAHWLVSHILEDDRLLADFRRTGTIVHRFWRTAKGSPEINVKAPPPAPALGGQRPPDAVSARKRAREVEEVGRGQGFPVEPVPAGLLSRPFPHSPAV